MKTAKLYGYSDDCAHVEIGGKDQFVDEYSDKRIRIVIPGIGEIVATLDYDREWGVSFEIPDGVEVVAELNNYGDGWKATEDDEE